MTGREDAVRRHHASLRFFPGLLGNPRRRRRRCVLAALGHQIPLSCRSNSSCQAGPGPHEDMKGLERFMRAALGCAIIRVPVKNYRNQISRDHRMLHTADRDMADDGPEKGARMES